MMKETPQEYVARMLRNIEGKDSVKVQSATAKKLHYLIKNRAPSKLRKRPAPGKWSVVEILAHMAETEFAAGWRIRQALSSPGIALQAFDQDAWANTGHYDKRPAHKWVDQFRALREANLRLLRSLTLEQWKYHGVHEERGPQTIEQMVRMTAGHDINHTRQIELILRP
jgi:uncharacterized damage-inducible protein DinB